MVNKKAPFRPTGATPTNQAVGGMGLSSDSVSYRRLHASKVSGDGSSDFARGYFKNSISQPCEERLRRVGGRLRANGSIYTDFHQKR